MPLKTEDDMQINATKTIHDAKTSLVTIAVHTLQRKTCYHTQCY